jgi:hypothetical protein
VGRRGKDGQDQLLARRAGSGNLGEVGKSNMDSLLQYAICDLRVGNSGYEFKIAASLPAVLKKDSFMVLIPTFIFAPLAPLREGISGAILVHEGRVLQSFFDISKVFCYRKFWVFPPTSLSLSTAPGLRMGK